jgi:hypothetical protein
MGRLNDNAATVDAIEEVLQSRHLLMDAGFNGGRDLHVTEGDLQRMVHTGGLGV